MWNRYTVSITWSLGTWGRGESPAAGVGGLQTQPDPSQPHPGPPCGQGGGSGCHHQVDDTEVLLQPVAHELDAHVDEETQLQVRGFEGGQVLGGDLGIQVSRFDPGVLGQVIHHLRRAGHLEGAGEAQGRCPPPQFPCQSPGEGAGVAGEQPQVSMEHAGVQVRSPWRTQESR